MYTLDLYSWQTNRSNWSYSSCDRSRCPNDSKALSMSSSHAINTLKHHSLDLPANRPDMSDPVRAWKPSIAEARLCPNLLYTGWTGMFLFKLPFPVRKLMLQGRLGYICIIRRNTSVSGDAITTSACLSIERACSRSKVSASSWLWVTRLEGTQMLPLVSVPDVTMNFFSLFVGPLL